MANETQYAVALSSSKGAVSISVSASATSNQEESGFKASNVQTIGTSAEPLLAGDVALPGFLFVKNLDATNFVQLALDSGVSTQIFSKLLPGQFCLLPIKTVTMYAKADTGACKCIVVMISGSATTLTANFAVDALGGSFDIGDLLTAFPDGTDGYDVAPGDTVLMFNSSDARNNGLYIVTEAGERSPQMASLSVIHELVYVRVAEGITNGGKRFVLAGPFPRTVDVNSLDFTIG